MLGFLMWFVSARRARSAIARGDFAAARDAFERFVARVPRSRLGWSSLAAVSLQAGDSLDQRLALSRRACAAVPYHFMFVNDLVANLLNSMLRTNDPALLVEANATVDEFESLLGESPESWILRSDIAQLEGNMEEARSLCRRAEERLATERLGPVTARLGVCMASIPGEEDRAIELLERAAPKANNYRFHIFLAVLLEQRNPGKSKQMRDLAQADATRGLVPPEAFEREVEEIRGDFSRQLHHKAVASS